MSEVVLDASAVLALLRDEPGADVVAGHIGRAAFSAVNLQEVVKEMLREGATPEGARAVLDELALALHPHDEEAAYAAAALYPETRRHGRGLGDRSCMALGSSSACLCSRRIGSGRTSWSRGSPSRWCGEGQSMAVPA